MTSEGYVAAPERQETSRLLPVVSKEDNFDIEAGEQRSFEGGLCDCCGKCDHTGATTCALGYFAPCIPFGLNAQRLFGKSAVKYGILSFFLIFTAGILQQAARPFYEAKFRAACGPDPFHPVQSKACKDASNQQLIIIFGIGLLALILTLIMALWGAKVRTDMRRKFNIPGSYFGDLCTWFWCSRCAVCQETRTVWVNNIQDGIWHGP